MRKVQEAAAMLADPGVWRGVAGSDPRLGCLGREGTGWGGGGTSRSEVKGAAVCQRRPGEGPRADRSSC